MFTDTAKLRVRAGDGGNGKVSFFRSKDMRRAKPDGGNGGKGGDVYIIATDSISTLSKYRVNKLWSADSGLMGGNKKSFGSHGNDLYISLPIGVTLSIDGQQIYELTDLNESILIAKGGRGGFGNSHFTTSIRQGPKFAELGEPGEDYEFDLELKTIADIGLVGLPNAGKSTMLSILTKAKPKIADYPFTTLRPHLGVLEYSKMSAILADIPGLISGASQGKGLGDTFLKHIERTRLLLHLVDISLDSFVEDYHVIRKELKEYRIDLSQKTFVILATKTDIPGSKIAKKRIKDLERISNNTVWSFDITNPDNVLDLKKKIINYANQVNVDNVSASKPSNNMHVFNLDQDERHYSIEQIDGVFVITGKKIERFAKMTNFSQWQAVDRLRDICDKMGINNQLRKMANRNEDILIRIGDSQEFYL